MNSLSHEQVRALIQQDYPAEASRSALRAHLASCDDCRTYAAMHVGLRHRPPIVDVRPRPAAEQYGAIMAAVDAGREAPLFWRPLKAIGSIAAILFLITAFWLVVGSIRPTTTRPTLSSPVGTAVAPLIPLPIPVLTAASPSPAPPATPDPAGRYTIITIPAPALAGNRIGEPVEQQVVVYLPPSYDSSDRRYPVVYGLLTTDSVSSRRASDNTAVAMGELAETAMKLALNDGTQEMIVVMPDPVNSLGLQNYYVNSLVTGNWETFVARDLVDYIDRNYRTLPSAESRGIFGEYRHGLSALLLAARYPDVFSAVSVLQPKIFYPGYSVSEAFFQSRVGRSLMDDLLVDARQLPVTADATWLTNRFPEDTFIPNALGDALAYGMAFAPNAEAGPPFFDYPFQELDGAPDPAVLRRWEDGLGNVNEKLTMLKDALARLDIQIDYYENISMDGPAGSVYLSNQLTDLGIAHTARSSSLFQPSSLAVLGKEILLTFSRVLTFE